MRWISQPSRSVVVKLTSHWNWPQPVQFAALTSVQVTMLSARRSRANRRWSSAFSSATRRRVVATPIRPSGVSPKSAW